MSWHAQGHSGIWHWQFPTWEAKVGWGFDWNLPIVATSEVSHRDCMSPWSAPGKLKSSKLYPRQLQLSEAPQECRWWQARERFCKGADDKLWVRGSAIFNLGHTRLQESHLVKASLTGTSAKAILVRWYMVGNNSYHLWRQHHVPITLYEMALLIPVTSYIKFYYYPLSRRGNWGMEKLH